MGIGVGINRGANYLLAKRLWKERSKRVIIPYAKIKCLCVIVLK